MLGKIKYHVERLSLLETFIIIVCIFSLLAISLLAIFRQNIENNDLIRGRNIDSVVKALEQYYIDSSFNELTKRYPISVCSTNSPNSVDYEYTLKNALSKTTSKTNSFIYINESIFPQDPSSKTEPIEQKISREGLVCIKDIDYREYGKNGNACKTPCYLYASSSNGDQYSLAYFQDSKNTFIKKSQVRNKSITTIEVGQI
jgi:hypothetical protein